MDHFAPDEPKLEEIARTIERLFGISVKAAEPIERGWLNRKWRLDTDRGSLFAKQYHPKRYQLHQPDKLTAALVRQNRLHAAGFPCPRVYMWNGEPLLTAPSGTKFVLTEYCRGEVIAPGRANAEQMADLGRAAGRMHALLKQGDGRPQPPGWSPDPPEVMLEAWANNWREAQGKPCPDGLMEALELQREIIGELDVRIFEECATGWTHWDLWVDNLLFYPDRLSAVLDFDRMRVLYPEMDVARALLSCALDVEAGRMNLGLVEAFLEGYRTASPFPAGTLVRAFKLLWCLEAANWMVAGFDMHSPPPARFARENIWLTRRWRELGEMFGDV